MCSYLIANLRHSQHFCKLILTLLPHAVSIIVFVSALNYL